MLPAVSADLPAALIPPSGRAVGQTPVDEGGFGPATRVAFSTERAIQGQSNEPGNGVYGPNGRFVENASRRDAGRARRDEPAPAAGPSDRPGEPAASAGAKAVSNAAAAAPRADADESAGAARKPDVEPSSADRDESETATASRTSAPVEVRTPDQPAARDIRRGTLTADKQGRDTEPPVLRVEGEEPERLRDLALAEFDAVVPPAAREELAALADRVNQRADSRTLDSDDYRLISDLMARLGRFAEANDAIERARELEDRIKPG